MGCAQSNQSKDDATAKAGASHDDVALVESRAAAAKFYEKQLAERDARIAALAAPETSCLLWLLCAQPISMTSLGRKRKSQEL